MERETLFKKDYLERDLIASLMNARMARVSTEMARNGTDIIQQIDNQMSSAIWLDSFLRLYTSTLDLRVKADIQRWVVSVLRMRKSKIHGGLIGNVKALCSQLQSNSNLFLISGNIGILSPLPFLSARLQGEKIFLGLTIVHEDCPEYKAHFLNEV